MRQFFARSMFAVPILILTTAVTTFAQASGVMPNGDIWAPMAFDFSAPALNFKSTVPQDAKVEMVPMDPTEPDSIGKVKIIGKVTAGKTGQKVETTIVGYNLQAPAAASRVCSFEAKASGYTPRLVSVTPDLTEAQLFANKAENGKTLSAAFSYCFARANQALAIHFIVDLSSAETVEAANDLVHQTNDFAQSFIRSLTFGNNQQSSFGDDWQTVPLRIGDKETWIHVPHGWDIPINDFRGSLPAELHMVRRKNGKDVGLVWLFVQDMKEKPDLETSGTAIVKDYFVKQTPDARPPVLISSGEDTTLAQLGIAAHTFRFSVEDKKGSDAGDIETTVIWHEGRLSVLTLWSAWTSAPDRNSFFSRLPGLTVYDIVRRAALTGQ